MKRVIFFAVISLLTVVSCERVVNVEKNEIFEKPIKQKHDQNSNRTATDSIKVKYVSSASESEFSDSSEDVDPKDIQTPPRK